MKKYNNKDGKDKIRRCNHLFLVALTCVASSSRTPAAAFSHLSFTTTTASSATMHSSSPSLSSGTLLSSLMNKNYYHRRSSSFQSPSSLLVPASKRIVTGGIEMRMGMGFGMGMEMRIKIGTARGSSPLLSYPYSTLLFDTASEAAQEEKEAISETDALDEIMPTTTDVNGGVNNGEMDTIEEKLPLSKSKISEEAEWESILQCFTMYRTAYGDLKVPMRFIVPSMKPWPESGWGMNLGRRVAQIRATGKFVDKEERRKALDEIGFLWRVRSNTPKEDATTDDVTFEQLYDALVSYKTYVLKADESNDSESPFNVPSNFVVPNYDPFPESTRGMPLGKKVTNLRSRAYLKANVGAEEKLRSINFQLDGKMASNDEKFNLIYKTLAKYKEKFGDLFVPQPFVVPSEDDDWPEEMWGLKLGIRVNSIRSHGTFVRYDPARRAKLENIGFVWDAPNESGRKRGRKRKVVPDVLNGPAPPGLLSPPGPYEPGTGGAAAAAAVAAQKEGRGPSWAPPTFGLPDSEYEIEEEYNEETQQQKDEAERQRKLEILFRPMKDLNQTLSEAAEMAIECGVIEGVIDGKVIKRKREIEHPWYNDDFGDDFVYEDVVEALKVYKKIYGNFDGLDTHDFVVPDPSEDAGLDIDVLEPISMDDISPGIDDLSPSMDDLSPSMDDISSSMDDLSPSMDDISSSMDGISSSMGDISPSMDDLNNILNQNIDLIDSIEDKELIGSWDEDGADSWDEDSWPEYLAGMRLGSITCRIRDGSLEVGHLPERRAALDAIGFDWGDPAKYLDIPFEKACCAMMIYFYVRGDLLCSADFIIPNDEPWPLVTRDYELGATVKRYRELYNFFHAYHPEKVQIMRAFDFYWVLDVALPLNPEDNVDESVDDYYVEGIGHPFYLINNPPDDLIEANLNRGFIGSPNKNKSYYDFNLLKKYHYSKFVEPGTFEDVWESHPANDLLVLGFEQLSREHELEHGASPHLEIIRLFETFNENEITQSEYDKRCTPYIDAMHDRTFDNHLYKILYIAMEKGMEGETVEKFSQGLERLYDVKLIDLEKQYQGTLSAKPENNNGLLSKEFTDEEMNEEVQEYAELGDEEELDNDIFDENDDDMLVEEFDSTTEVKEEEYEDEEELEELQLDSFNSDDFETSQG